MNISFNSISRYTTVSFLKESIAPSFTAQQKKIVVVALIAIGFLVAAWLFVSRRIDKDKKILIEDKSQKQDNAAIKGIENKSDEQYIMSEKELQKGILISEETLSKIQTSMKNVLQCKEEGGVKLYDCKANHRVFSLDTAPDLIFKMKADKNSRAILRDDSLKARYHAMVNAQTVLQSHRLGLLVLPHAKMLQVNVEGEEYDIIAEQKLDINPNESAQEKLFEDYAVSLNGAILHLATFICKTGYSDVEWRNNPVLNNSLDGIGQRKIALIDIEHLEGAETGLFGGLDRTGLVGLVNEEQGKIVEKVAKQNGVDTSLFARAHDKRKKALENEHKLNEYYVQKNITTGDEPIEVDIDSLGLDLNQEGQITRSVKVNDVIVERDEMVNLRMVVEDVIKKMNELIRANDSQSSIKGKRHFLLNINKRPLYDYNDLGGDNKAYVTSEEQEKQKWLSRIIQSLIDKGHIFRLVKANAHGYYIQA